MDINEYANALLLTEPDLSEKELQERVNGYIGICWRSETAEGREFTKFFASRPGNVEALAAVFDTLDEAVSFESLSAAFRTLRQNGRIQSDAEVEQARLETGRQRDEANRRKWELDCSRYVETHSTNEVKARAESDPAFRAYLKAANQLPELPVEYSAEATAKQRAALKIQKEKDARHKNVPDELRAFAETYKHLPAGEALKRMNEPSFKASVEACASAGIL